MYQEVTKENFWNAVSWPKSQFIEIDIWNVWSSIFYQYRGVFSGFHARFLGHIINSSFWTYAPHWPLTYHLHYHLEKVVANVTWLSGVVKSHHIKEVVNVTFWQWGGETLILHWGWWTSGVVIVWVVNVLQSTFSVWCLYMYCVWLSILILLCDFLYKYFFVIIFCIHLVLAFVCSLLAVCVRLLCSCVICGESRGKSRRARLS